MIRKVVGPYCLVLMSLDAVNNLRGIKDIDIEKIVKKQTHNEQYLFSLIIILSKQTIIINAVSVFYVYPVNFSVIFADTIYIRFCTHNARNYLSM